MTLTLTLSRNEVESLGLKAARGAGFSWGLAEEAGLGLGWLWAEGIDATAALLALLTARGAGQGRPVPGPGRWRAAKEGAALCPIALGAALLDRAGLADGPLSLTPDLGPVAAPVLLVPFLFRAGQAGQAKGAGLLLEWPGGGLRIGPTGLVRGSLADLGAAPLVLRTRPAPGSAEAPQAQSDPLPPPPLPPPPLPPPHLPAPPLPSIAADILKGLEALALRTTVPPQRDLAQRGGQRDAGQRLTPGAKRPQVPAKALAWFRMPRTRLLAASSVSAGWAGSSPSLPRIWSSGLALTSPSADQRRGSTPASIGACGDSIPTPLSGAAVSEAGRVMIWGAEAGVTFTRPLTQDPSGAAAPDHVPDDAVTGGEYAFPIAAPDFGGTNFAALSTLTGFYRPREDRLVLLGSQGEVMELSPSGAVLSKGQYPAPGPDLAAAEISFPTPTVDVVLWTPTDEGAPAMIGRYDRRTRSLLRMVETQSVDDDSRLAERADLMVSLDASGMLHISDTRNGEIVGRITPEGEGFLTPAPSAEGQILGFDRTGRSLYVIHRSQAPPPRDPQVSAEGLRVQTDLIRPLPVVAQGGLHLSAELCAKVGDA